jgi:hypothetical protein
MTVNPVLIPTINISASNLDICSGTNVDFTASSATNGGLNPSYQWQLSIDEGANFNDIGVLLLIHILQMVYQMEVFVEFTSSATCAAPHYLHKRQRLQ